MGALQELDTPIIFVSESILRARKSLHLGLWGRGLRIRGQETPPKSRVVTDHVIEQ